MGTRMDILLFGDDWKQLETLWNNAEKEIRMLEKMLNRFDPDSEVSIVNDSARFSAVELSDELWNILLDCRRYNQLTDGYFDVTWKDFGKIVFQEEWQRIMFQNDKMFLDFGAYAKGYALKKVHKRLEADGVKRALISFGNSSVLAIGAHPHGAYWPVGIEDPMNGVTLSTIQLCDSSLSVSGNTPSHPSHIMNPKTLETITGDPLVAIVADDPVDAEVLTTAWIATGHDMLPDWMMNFNLKNTYRLK
jgi:thiamine biosynthesis lipoprotein